MLFAKTKTYIVDFETLSDPRVARFLELGLVCGRLLAPKPPLAERDAGDDHRSRRAWEAIARLRRVKGLSVRLEPSLLQRDTLIATLRRSKATLITVNSELKVACNGLPVVSASEIYDLFRPVYLSGAELRVKLSKRGKERDEAIGYLEGGIKVVVENGVGSLGKEIDVIVQGALDTDVGRVIFARPRFTDVD